MTRFKTLPAPFRWCGPLAILLLSACATTPTQPLAIDERAQIRWDTLLAGDFETAYSYLSPGFRSSVSLEQYTRKIQTQKVRWTGARYIDSECLESSCKVKISIDYSLYGALPGVPRFDGTQEITENWVRQDERWWHVPKN